MEQDQFVAEEGEVLESHDESRSDSMNKGAQGEKRRYLRIHQSYLFHLTCALHVPTMALASIGLFMTTHFQLVRADDQMMLSCFVALFSLAGVCVMIISIFVCCQRDLGVDAFDTADFTPNGSTNYMLILGVNSIKRLKFLLGTVLTRMKNSR